MAISPRAWPTCSAMAGCPASTRLLVSRKGRLLFEYYGEGEAENWGMPLGKVKFGPTVLHDLRSVTKSLVGMLYGIALADGKVPPPEARLYDQFPEYPDLAQQPGRDRITIAHVLSMTMGLDWDELTHPYGDPRNSENRMEEAPDRYRYILSLPIAGEPGVKWTYCGGATALLGHLIAERHRAEARRLCAACAVRSARAGACRMVDRSQGRAARGFGLDACGRPTCCVSARWCWPTAPGRASRSCRRTG